jgi:hypothetical protein
MCTLILLNRTHKQSFDMWKQLLLSDFSTWYQSLNHVLHGIRALTPSLEGL